MDDEQGPWWTRPPEPEPQDPPDQRRQPGGQSDVNDQRADSPIAEPTIIYPPTERAAVDFIPPEYTRPIAAPAPEPPPEETLEPPAPPKPMIRRVAVVPPTPPPLRSVGRGQREALTESLPPVSDDIFATFSGPQPVRASTPPPTRSGAAPQRAARIDPADPPGEPLGSPDRLAGLLPQVKLPEPRVLLLAAAAALVLLLIVVVALVSGRGTDADPSTASPSIAPTAGAGASAFSGKTPDGLKQVSAIDAAAQLRKVNQGPGGSIVEAWGWTDKNGRNLVVTSIDAVGGNRRTLRVVHVAGLDGNPRTLRVMTDPNLPTNCQGPGTARFTPKALIVRDLDGNNIAEVITGWTSRCGGKENQSQVRLALITNGDKYILRGQGVLGKPGTFTPAPRPSQWPPNYLNQLRKQYRKLYG